MEDPETTTILELQIKNPKVAADLQKLSRFLLQLNDTPWYKFRKRAKLQTEINQIVWRVLVWAAYYGEVHGTAV